jgi:membrane associated rhomboid family serine protease
VRRSEPDPRQSFALRGRAAPIVLGDEGVHHPSTPAGRGHAYSRYADLTHVTLTGRSLWIGTKHGTTAIFRALFALPDGSARLAQALLERVEALPDGAARSARMRELDRMAREPHPAVATWTLAALCAVGFALQVVVGIDLYEVGYSSRALVVDGDWWRLLTAGLLHGFPLHLATNLVGLVFFGRLVERALGTPRVLAVMGVSQVFSMAIAAVAHGGGVVGISGVVAGLVGALLYMEMRLGSDLPAWWRLPRWLFFLLVAVILLQGLLDRLLPFIAAEAHLGGFAAGFTTVAFLMRAHRVHEPAGARVRAAAAVVCLATLAAIGAAAGSLLAPDDFRARHAARLARLPGISSDELNTHAWMIAVDPESTGEQLEGALALAERAVRETRRGDATLLDTLAEVQFQLGRGDLAVSTIDEALERSPDARFSEYLKEQRRRFTGERDPDDRPPDPGLPWPDDREIPLPPDDGGVRV